MKNKKEEFIFNGNNHVLIRKGYYISYNDFSHQNIIRETTGMLVSLLQQNKDFLTVQEETALCKDNKFLILNGDFRKNYLKCKNYSECLKFFKSKEKQYKSIWSN